MHDEWDYSPWRDDQAKDVGPVVAWILAGMAAIVVVVVGVLGALVWWLA